jgi:ATP-dependent DNA helicase RecG
MAPTQILAEQHYLNFKRWLEPLGVRVALRTGSRQETTATMPLFDGQLDDEPQILVGTHALLYDGVRFKRLGLAVIDEQHKFGVLQRAALMKQPVVPDVLVMTATPIPRTLTMTVFGDLDVSTLDELPANRGKIITLSTSRPSWKPKPPPPSLRSGKPFLPLTVANCCMAASIRRRRTPSWSDSAKTRVKS